MPSQNQPGTGLGHINTLEDQRYAAMAAGDIPALEKMFDDGLVYVHSTGLLHGKKEYLDLLRSGTVRYLDFHRTDNQVRLFDGCAIASIKVRSKLLYSGKEVQMDNRVTSTWAQSPEGWRLVMVQSTPLKDPP